MIVEITFTAEERQDANDKEKRRRIDMQSHYQSQSVAPDNTPSMRNGIDYVPVLSETHQDAFVPAPTPVSQPIPSPSRASAFVPAKPRNPMFVSSARGPSGTAPIRGGFINPSANAAAAPSRNGGGDDPINRVAVRKANLSAAEALRAELLAGKKGLIAKPPPPAIATPEISQSVTASAVDHVNGHVEPTASSEEETEVTNTMPADSVSINGDHLGSTSEIADFDPKDLIPMATVAEQDSIMAAVVTTPPAAESDVEEDVLLSAVDGTGVAASSIAEQEVEESKTLNLLKGNSNHQRGKKRSANEADIPATRSQAELEALREENGDHEDEKKSVSSVEEEADSAGASKPFVPKPLKLLGGNMVEQEDTVK